MKQSDVPPRVRKANPVSHSQCTSCSNVVSTSNLSTMRNKSKHLHAKSTKSPSTVKQNEVLASESPSKLSNGKTNYSCIIFRSGEKPDDGGHQANNRIYYSSERPLQRSNLESPSQFYLTAYDRKDSQKSLKDSKYS